MAVSHKGLIVPEGTDTANAPDNFVDFVDSGPLARFATTAERDAAFTVAPPHGTVCMVNGVLHTYADNGSGGGIWWNPSPRLIVKMATTLAMATDATAEVVRWDTTVLNDGNYSATTHAWTAPHTGYIEVYGSIILSMPQGYLLTVISAGVYSNGVEVGRFGGAHTTQISNSCCGTVVIHVNGGETIDGRVYISGANSKNKNIYAGSRMSLRYIDV